MKEDGTQRLSPNYSGSRLTEKSAKLLHLEDRELATEFPGSDKWIWPGPNGTSSCVNGTHAVWGFVILESGTESLGSFERAKDTAAFEILWSQIKFPWMSLPGWRARQFGVIANLASHCAVFRWRRDAEATRTVRRPLVLLEFSRRRRILEAPCARNARSHRSQRSLHLACVD